MVSTVEERLAKLEERVDEMEVNLTELRRPARSTGITIEEAKARLQEPVERGQRELEQLRAIIGMFDGPVDLSERMRDYLYGDIPNGDRAE